MTKLRRSFLMALTAMSATTLVQAQVEARTAPSSDSNADVEIASPMQVEVAIPAFQFTAAMTRKSRSQKWTTKDTGRFVTDKARVRSITVERLLKGKNVDVEISAEVATAWFRQDVHLTIALLGPDGNEVASKSWRNLTIGNQAGSAFVFGSSTKHPSLEQRMSVDAFYALLSGEEPSKVRITLEIVSD